MRQQNVIMFSAGKNKCVAHEIARGLDGGVCKAVVWDEIDLFRNTLAQFPILGENGACHATASDAEAGMNRIIIDEIAFAEPIDKKTMPWLSAV